MKEKDKEKENAIGQYYCDHNTRPSEYLHPDEPWKEFVPVGKYLYIRNKLV